MKNIILILCFIIFCAGCNETTGQASQTEEANNQAQQTVASNSTQPKEQSAFDGTYLFDVETYKAEQLKQDDSIFKKMSVKDLERMMMIFRPFKIEVEGNIAKASFSQEVIQGNLKTLNQSNQSARLFMIPVDENKKNETATLIIDGENLVLDPGKKERDKMYFKKVVN